MFGGAILSLALLAAAPPPVEGKPVRLKSQPGASAVGPETLSFRELFEASPRELKPSQKLLALNGKRVTMVGYMAQMEIAPLGAFYLASAPVSCAASSGTSRTARTWPSLTRSPTST